MVNIIDVLKDNFSIKLTEKLGYGRREAALKAIYTMGYKPYILTSHKLCSHWIKFLVKNEIKRFFITCRLEKLEEVPPNTHALIVDFNVIKSKKDIAFFNNHKHKFKKIIYIFNTVDCTGKCQLELDPEAVYLK